MAQGDRDAGVGGHGDGRGDARARPRRARPASASAAASSPPRANTNGSPPLSRTTVRAGAAPLDEQRVDLVLGHRDLARRLADADPLGVGGRQVEQRLDREPVVHDHVGPAQHLVGAHGEQPGIPGPGAHQVHGHAVSSASAAISQWPRCWNSSSITWSTSDASDPRAPPGGAASPSAFGESMPASMAARSASIWTRQAVDALVQLGHGRGGGELGVAVAIGRPADAHVAEPELGDAAAVDHEARHRVDVRCDRTLVDPLVAQPIGHREHLVEGQPRVAGRGRRGELHGQHGNAAVAPTRGGCSAAESVAELRGDRRADVGTGPRCGGAHGRAVRRASRGTR